MESNRLAATPTPSNDESEGRQTSAALSKPQKRIPSDQWELMRPIITKLYQEERKSLREVIEILERDHGFKATVKMFKSRIWKWGLDKKLKGDEVLAILLLKRDRDAVDKLTQFTIRGHPVDLENINRYIKRNPSLMTRFRTGQTPSIQTSLEVRCHTPPPQMLSPPRPLAASVESQRAEQIMHLFRSYVDGCLATGTWQCEYDVSCTSHVLGERSEELFERVIASFALVNRCLMRGDQISIGAVLNPAFESLREIISTESPTFAVRTVCLLWYLNRHHKNNLLRLVVDYLGGLMPIVLGPSHYLAQIWRILGTTMFSDYYDLSACLYSMLVPLLEERLGPANHVTTVIYGDHVDCLFQRSDSSAALTAVNRYRKKVDATGRQHPWLTELAITQTAILCASKEAQGLIGDAISCLQTLQRHHLTEEQETVVDVQLGNYMFQLNDMPGAIGAYRKALRMALAFDSDERLILTCLANMESALSYSGRTFEAHRVTQYRLRRVGDFAAKSQSLTDYVMNIIGPDAVAPSLPPPSIHTGGSVARVPASPTYMSQLYAEEAPPSWLWRDEYEYVEPVKPAVVPEEVDDPLGWLAVTCGAEERPTTAIMSHSDSARSSEYPSLSPAPASWGTMPRSMDHPWAGGGVYQ